MVLIVPKDDDDEDDDDGDDWYYVRLVAGFRGGRYVGPAWVAKEPNWQSAQYFEDEVMDRVDIFMTFSR